MNTYTTTKTTTAKALRTWKVSMMVTGKIQNFDVVATTEAAAAAWVRKNATTGTILSII